MCVCVCLILYMSSIVNFTTPQYPNLHIHEYNYKNVILILGEMFKYTVLVIHYVTFTSVDATILLKY